MEHKFQTPDGKLTTVSATQESGEVVIITIEGRSYRVILERNESGSMLLNIDGKRVAVQTARNGNMHHIALRDQTVALEKITGANRGRERSQQAGDLSAAMPGQIVEVRVKVGDSVVRGQTLLILEAMKMETRIKAPHDGTVKGILCAAGETVDRGQLLIELEETSSAQE